MLPALEQACSQVPFGSDLFGLLTRTVTQPEPVTKRDVDFLINLVHGAGYSTLHLFADLRQVERAFIRALPSPAEQPQTDFAWVEKLRSALDDIFALVLQEAMYADAPKLAALEESFLERLALAAIKLDRDFRITYANPATMHLLGTSQDIRGLKIYDIFPRVATVSAQMERRRAGAGDLYETEILRSSDRKAIPVSVAGTPILDEHGICIGTLGILRSIEREKVSEAIHNLVETERDADALLTCVAQQIGRYVPFDYFGVSRFSLSSDHVSAFCTYVGSGIHEDDRRWWHMSAEQKLDYSAPQVICEYDAYVRLRRPEFAAEPSLKKFLELNFLSAIRIPVWRRERLVASILLLSRRPYFYTQEHLDQLLALPLERAVEVALSLHNQRESDFRNELFRKAVKCATPPDLAALLVAALAVHYQWHHVAIFQVCDDRSMFKLIAEHFEYAGNALPLENHRQPLDRGVLGHVYRTRECANITDVHRQGHSFVSGWPGVSSEICIPLIRDGEVHWLLNVEDLRVDAFSKDDENDLKLIAGEIELLLARMFGPQSPQPMFAATFPY